ncbi:response regulator [Sphingomonas solaris]|uniref:Response regulator n=1 Tax=Alterirhizorhabdus solaris TaxID=2529389 RepID=A0A558R0C1_9SPHN|nr:response regulator [Sphingomonas solaris]TVV72826.1 response regulator [Sphingomonas solaris]
MLFGRKTPRLKRILVVEDEPLVAFDNEHLLGDAGYTVVATVDRVTDAVRVIETDGLDLVLSDVRLSGDGDGLDVARAAQARGVPLLFVTGTCPMDAAAISVGCLAKPYSPRDLLAAIEAVEAKVVGDRIRRRPPGLQLFD